MDIRKRKIICNKTGGNASDNSKTYKISLPTSWVSKLGVSDGKKEVMLYFSGDEIIIKPNLSLDEFVQKAKRKNHNLTSWVSKLGVSDGKKEVMLYFSGDEIIIKPNLSLDEFVQKAKRKNHNLLQLDYYDGDTLCTVIVADYTSKEVKFVNFTDNAIKRAFGILDYVTWEEYEDFLEERCVCTVIVADYTSKEVKFVNFTDNAIKRAFGILDYVTWEEYEDFLEERCVPKSRANIQDYLKCIGLLEYNPLDIIMKTQGIMAEDEQWIGVKRL